jgi:hypothetical protein
MWLLWRDVNTLRAELATTVYQARQAKASIYICTTVVRYNRSRDGRGGKHVGTDDTPSHYFLSMSQQVFLPISFQIQLLEYFPPKQKEQRHKQLGYTNIEIKVFNPKRF